MHAGPAHINTIFPRGRLIEIPYYQRAYVWGEDEWAQFLDDMVYVSSARRPYFLGSIILKAESHSHTFEDDKYYSERWTVIDGQQRLSTIIIFFKAMLLKQGKNASFSSFLLDNGKVMLAPGRRDAADFERIVKQETANPLDAPADESRMIHAFNYFLKNIDPDSVDNYAIERYIDMVTIEVSADEDEQQIFDTINSRGVQLTTAELLKNYFFNKENKRDFEEYWEEVFEKDIDTQKYWDQELVTGRIRRTLIDLFFDSFLQIKIQERQYGVTAEDKKRYERVDQLFASYKDFIDHYYEGDKIQFVHELKPYADLFKDNINPDAPKQSMPAEMGMDRVNVLIFGLKNSTMIAYVLYLCKEVADDTERCSIFQIIENYILRRLVTRQTTKNYNRLFTSLILNEVKTASALSEHLARQDDSTMKVPSDTEVEEAFVKEDGLYNLDSKGILYFIESRIRAANSSTALLGFDNYSLEHLMPKNWRSKWERLDSEEEERSRDKALYTMGNLAIITQSLNASIRDADWNTKKTGKANKTGLKECASGLATINDVLEHEVWDESAIEERGEWLSEKALGLWKV